MNESLIFQWNNQVRHSRFGSGTVITQDGPAIIVRFSHGIEAVRPEELLSVTSLSESAHSHDWHPLIRVIARIQAESIQSLNDTWGVFSQSRVELLPHQLWVCQKVNGAWPTRWIVADDVGLGKTIEAGLILSSLISNSRVKRLLVICPASLVSQWQQRIREMFDIRLSRYLPELDTKTSDFWNGHNQVVASLQTLRADNSGRHERLMDSEKWDMVIVDEAHHLNYDEHGGPTLGYRLLKSLSEAEKFDSTVFFTGTPHRGKNVGFIALLELIRPDLFDLSEPFEEQLHNLSKVMIRNNKQNVTDLRGNKLFKKVNLLSETYHYTSEEKYFYDTLTDFIASGKAYATSLNAQDQRVAILVLITMQKLASSSIAAIKNALNNRLGRIVDIRTQIEKLESTKKQLSTIEKEVNDLEADNDTEAVSEIEEELIELSATLSLMRDEVPRIKNLLEAADRVGEETKIKRIISMMDDQFALKSVLLFTEYKSTQSMIMTELINKYGDDAVTFINGDGIAKNVVSESGNVVDLREDRNSAASRFNNGEVRFLVSTEAAGEGIDLQENCHSLIHIDLPWNPMRLHQRVGRLNRYGQTQQVSVVQLRNPDTVESRIWDLLNIKLNNISKAFEHVMQDPEDLMEIILGMTSSTILREVFAEGEENHIEGLNEWFDQKTATFGGKDVIEAVENIIGNVSRFDYQSVSEKLPTSDLPDLEPFIRLMMRINNRRYSVDQNGEVGFTTPEDWLHDAGVRRMYRGLVYDRTVKNPDAASKILGVGHKVIDTALTQAKEFYDSVAEIDPAIISSPMTVFRISDKLTTESRIIKTTVVGITISEEEIVTVYNDEQLLHITNEAVSKLSFQVMEKQGKPNLSEPLIDEVLATQEEAIKSLITSLELPFSVPAIVPICILWPKNIA